MLVSSVVILLDTKIMFLLAYIEHFTTIVGILFLVWLLFDIFPLLFPSIFLLSSNLVTFPKGKTLTSISRSCGIGWAWRLCELHKKLLLYLPSRWGLAPWSPPLGFLNWIKSFFFRPNLTRIWILISNQPMMLLLLLRKKMGLTYSLTLNSHFFFL